MMNSNAVRTLMRVWRAEFLAPKDLVRRAAIIGLLFFAAHACGLRPFTSVLSGTTASLPAGWQMSAFLGFTYIVLYLGLVLLVPVLLLAAALLAIWRWAFPSALIHPETTNDIRTDTPAKNPLTHLAIHDRSRR
jgi:hypothetical protein